MVLLLILNEIWLSAGDQIIVRVDKKAFVSNSRIYTSIYLFR